MNISCALEKARILQPWSFSLRVQLAEFANFTVENMRASLHWFSA